MTARADYPAAVALADVRDTPQFAAIARFYGAMFAPGTGLVHDVREVHPLGDGTFGVIGATFAGTLEEGPSLNAYRIDGNSGAITKWRRGGQRMAVTRSGDRCAMVVDGKVEIFEPATGVAVATLAVDGVVEQLRWSPAGRLALLVAGARADVSGAEGGFARTVERAGPAWLPEVDLGDSEDVWRRLWLWDGEAVHVTAVTTPPLNVWECAWAGETALAVVASDHHGEGSWYDASLRMVEVAGGAVAEAYRSPDQVAKPVASPDGTMLAFLEAVCSDRGIVCGTLRLLRDGVLLTVPTDAVEVSDMHWQTASRIVFAGLRGLETVIGVHDLAEGATTILWASVDRTCGDLHPSVMVDGDDIYAVTESYATAPALCRIEAAGPVEIRTFAAPNAERPAGHVEPVRWLAGDGLTIEGLLIRPETGAQGLPLLVDIHGGPIWGYRNRWAVRYRAAAALVAEGFAVLLPNPRGSAGRGQAFVRAAVNDMGGADMVDLISGIDHLAAIGVVDRDRVVLTGSSYGGFMSAWLVTQHPRIAAAVPISPVVDWYSQHFTSQIPSFDERCLDGSPTSPAGQYFGRSAVFQAAAVRTPTLTLVGAADKNTPPTQGLEWHNALLQAGVTSVLCTYPGAGHSLRGYPAYLDSAARVMLWAQFHTRR